MNTSAQALTESEIAKLKADMAITQAESAHYSIKTMEQEIAWLNDCLPLLKNEESLPDEIVMVMHNIVSVVHEEQYRFLKDMRRLFNTLPIAVKEQKSIKYLIDRLDMMKEDDLNTKANQPTDLSQYWSAYRRALYMNGVLENTRARRVQADMKKKLLAIAEETIKKRKQGIATAELIVSGKASMV